MSDAIKPVALTVEARFWPKVNKGADCWEWTGASHARGYGLLHFNGPTGRTSLKAHRVSWEIHNGPITGGLWVLHKCDNPPCVRPDHLFLGTRTDNMRDCASKGRIKTVGQAMKTKCSRGHDYTPENTIWRPNGHRRCATCYAAYLVEASAIKKARYAARKAAAIRSGKD